MTDLFSMVVQLILLIVYGAFLLVFGIVVMGFVLYVMVVIAGGLLSLSFGFWPFPVDIDAILQGYVDILTVVVEAITSRL